MRTSVLILLEAVTSVWRETSSMRTSVLILLEAVTSVQPPLFCYTQFLSAFETQYGEAQGFKPHRHREDF
jgi:hypothetical protein